MNHQKVYDSIILNAKSKNRKKLKQTQPDYVYYECHHIIPKCIGGSNHEDNLVLLTAREHYLCHKLLTYIHKGNKKIANAFCRMTWDKKGNRNISSKDYSYARELNIIAKAGIKQTEETKEKRRKSMMGKNKGKRMKKEFGEAVSKRLKGNIPWNKGKKNCYSEEAKRKMSVSATGVKNSKESNEKNRQSHLGKSTWNKGLTKHNDERIMKISQKISKSLKNKKV